MINQTKGIVHLFFVIVIVLIGIGGLLYFSWQKGLIKTNLPNTPPAPTTTENETADWKTYRNDKYGFEFIYPPNYSITNENDLAVFLTDGKSNNQIIVFLNSPEMDYDNPTGDMSFLGFATRTATQQCAADSAGPNAISTYCDKAIKEKAVSNPYGLEGYEVYLNLVTTKLNSSGNYQIISEISVGPVISLDVTKETHGRLRSIEILYGPIHNQVSEENLTVVDQIISTFKFTQ